MAEHDDALQRLIDHLEREAECLDRMDAVLAEEAEALRRLDIDAMQACAARKARLAEVQESLAPGRQPLLSEVAPAGPGAPRTLGALRARLSPRDEARLSGVHDRLGVVARRVVEQHRKNAAFAESGRAVVGGALRYLQQARAQACGGVYGRDGAVHGGETASVVRERG